MYSLYRVGRVRYPYVHTQSEGIVLINQITYPKSTLYEVKYVTETPSTPYCQTKSQCRHNAPKTSASVDLAVVSCCIGKSPGCVVPEYSIHDSNCSGSDDWRWQVVRGMCKVTVDTGTYCLSTGFHWCEVST